MTAREIETKALALLNRFYGYRSFRPGQPDIIKSVMSGRDTLVLMPTGGGKSICYQIPAMLGEGCTIVVSPLISLMKDQVVALNANGIPAAAVNSGFSEIDNRQSIREAMRGRIKLLYMSPERLKIELERNDFRGVINMFAIDEAHCISQWGHDFRPEYAALGMIKNRLGDIPVMALTATADKLTRDDIAKQLGLVDPYVHIASFDRPNLSLRVVPSTPKGKKAAYIARLIDRYPDDSGIVYTLSRKGAEAMDAALKLKGYRSAVYHAGLSASERDAAQERFISGELQVVCATVAFGMGIDKSNIRWVVHANMPRNMESYYQEIGRAGRDGLNAETTLFYSYADIVTLQSFINESGQPQLNSEKLNRMRDYCESHVCRRRVLLSYFNEVLDHDCGNCDVCLSPPERFDGTTFAKMALSAILRVNEKAGLTMTVDILRGSAKTELLRLGYDKIKTYGVGRMMSAHEWTDYISQFIQLGALDIAYDDSGHLKVTPYGRDILAGKVTVMLARHVDNPPAKKKKEPVESQPANPAELLFSKLKQLRREISEKEKIAPYLVFSDKTLMDMVRRRPVTMQEFIEVEGVGEKKCVKYWDPFTKLIKNFR